MRDSRIWCFNADILNFKYFICTPRKKNEDTRSCGINGIAEKKGLAGYHFNRTVRVQWFFLAIFIWGFYVCASWFKGTLNHRGWGVVDYAFNQVAGLGKVVGRATGASALGPRMLCMSFESVWKNQSHFHLRNKLQIYCSIYRIFVTSDNLLVSEKWNWVDLRVIKISRPTTFVLKNLLRVSKDALARAHHRI